MQVDRNGLVLTEEGRNVINSIFERITGRSKDGRMKAAEELLEILSTDGDLLNLYRGNSSKKIEIQGTLNRAFSKGDKDLNPTLKQIRKKIREQREPPKCVIIPLEALSGKQD